MGAILFIGSLWSSIAMAQEPGTIITIAGGGSNTEEGIKATDLSLKRPIGTTTDMQGNLYIADADKHCIYKVHAITKTVSIIAGTNSFGFSGDGGPAIKAELNTPQALALDSSGILYIADSGNRRIRKIDPNGIITTIAGTGKQGFSGDGGLATEAMFDEIVALLASESFLYVSDGRGLDSGNNRIRRINLSLGIIQTIAGNGSLSFSGDDGPATEAGLTAEGLAIDGTGNLYIADFLNHRIRKISVATGIITTVAGRGPADFFGGGSYEGDGGFATDTQLNFPTGVAIDSLGYLYIADTGNHRIRVADPFSNTVVTIAGTGNMGFAGDGAFALEAHLKEPSRLTIDPFGDLIIVDTSNYRIRKLIGIHYRTAVFSLITRLIDFGNVSLGIPEMGILDMVNRGNLSLTLLKITSNNPEFTFGSILPILLEPAESIQIPVYYNPVNEGVAVGLITLFTNDPRNPTSTVPIRGIAAVPKIGVFPTSISFNRTLTGNTQSLNIQISNLGVGTLLIVQASVTDTQFVIQITDTLKISSGQTQNLPVTFSPTQKGLQQATLTLFSNDPNDESVTIPLKGLAKIPKPGGFSSLGDSLGMGDSGAGFGVAWGDYDNDGDADLYVVRSLEPNLLYRNDKIRFSEIGIVAGVNDDGDGSAAAWADYDNDGDLDLYVTNFGQPNRLFRNENDHFVEVGKLTGVDDNGDSYGAAWADYDSDGDPDLYVVNFGANRFYRNDNGRFVERADSLGLSDASSGIQPAWGDYDNDGDPDLFLANSGPNRLFRNDDSLFTSVENIFNPRDNGPSFGAAWGDYDNDGDLDLYVSYFGEENRLYRNNGAFIDVAKSLGIDDPSRSRGAVWADFDNDGNLDLFVTNSGQPNRLFRREGETFTEIGQKLGVNADGDSRGIALSDYDNDGGLDFYVAIQNGPDRLYHNQEFNGNWLTIHPKGSESSFDAIGTRIQIIYGEGQRAIREITGGSSFLSQNALTATFGVGNADLIDTLKIRWPSGIIQRILNQKVNLTLEISEARPLPPTRINLESSTSTLIANGTAEIQLTASVVNTKGEIVLVNDYEITLRTDNGKGNLVGGNIFRTKEGIAFAQFRTGMDPGTVIVLAETSGLISGQLAIDLLPPLEDTALTLRTIAGKEEGFGGDGGPATESLLKLPRAVALDSSANIYIADTGNQRIRHVDAITGTIQTIVGDGLTGLGTTGNGGKALDARVASPRGLALLPNNDLLIAEQGGQTIRRVLSKNETIVAFAGRGISGFGGDGRPADKANLSSPIGIVADLKGNVWIADQFNHRIRKVNTERIITTVAGSAQPGFSGDGGKALNGRFTRPHAIAVNGKGHLFIADTFNHRIRQVDQNGILTTIAGTGESGFSGDGGPGILAQLNKPSGLAVKGIHLYISDTGNHRIRLLNLNSGLIQSVAGTGNSKANIKTGSALQINLNNPSGLAIGPTGSIYIADSGNHCIRELSVVFPDLPGVELSVENKAADFNRDGHIDLTDFLLLAEAFDSPDDRFDLNVNGQVDFGDFLLFTSAFQQSRASGLQ